MPVDRETTSATYYEIQVSGRLNQDMGVVMVAFWGIALWGFVASGNVQPLIMFGYIGTSIGVGLGLYATLPNPESPFCAKTRAQV